MTDSNKNKIEALKAELDRTEHILRDIQQDVLTARLDMELAIEDEELEVADSCDRALIRSMKIYASYRAEELDLQRRIILLGGKIS